MSTKMKGEKKKTKVYKSKKLIVPKWKLFRANEPLLSVFMWGINHSINELSHVPPPRLLLPGEFKAYSKVKVDNHLFNKENMPSHFKYKEYCPNVFRNLREKFGVTEIDYLKSFTNYQPVSTDSPGRSGARFYISYDKRLVIKALCPEEVVEMHSILPDYYEYVVEKHGKTLLPQYLGLYRLTVESIETYWIVMRNIFGGRYLVHKKFDLKGSTVQRQASGKERMKELPTFKDNDFLDEGYKLYLPDDAKLKLLDMLTSDTAFLAKLHLMDYSLLVGIHDCRRSIDPTIPQGDTNVPVTVSRERSVSGDTAGGVSPTLAAGDSSEPDAASLGSAAYGSQPTPPDSPVPTRGAFETLVAAGEPDLEDEFYAVLSRPDAPKKEIYFLGLVDILTYYGVKKKTASAAKSVKYGAEAEISTVKPDQYAKRLVEFVSKAVDTTFGASAWTVMNKHKAKTGSSGDNVRVVVRCRPISEQEIRQGCVSIVDVNESTGTVTVHHSNDDSHEPAKTFTYDFAFGPSSVQVNVYNQAARPIIENVLEGYNGTIFAYGQTGTGKTYTMEGDRSKPESKGIIPNSFAHIFGHIAKSGDTKTFLVRVSYLEIYNEEIRDLLAKNQNHRLEIKERPDIGVYVKDLSTVTVSNAEEMDKIMSLGNKNRSVGATNMNEQSSRSHAIFTITVECSALGLDKRHHVRMGKLHLVDLAGSERQSKTGATGKRLKEATKINLSLSTLGNVISALVDSKSTHVPYRNSKLTRLLQDSLGGNSKTLMCANFGPADYNYEETISTLRFANRAKNIKNHAHINEDPKDALLRKYQQEIEELKRQLAEGGNGDEAIEGSEQEDEEKEAELEQNAARNGKAKRKRKALSEQKIRDIESRLEADKKKLDQQKDMVEEERRTLTSELADREQELLMVKADHDRLLKKLRHIEKKVIVGGENLLEKMEEQARLLDESNRELEERQQKELELRKALEQKQAERLDIEEKYSSLQEEAAGKTKKMNKIWTLLKAAEAEKSDLEAEQQREMEGLLESVRQLSRELSLQMLIIDSFIPTQYQEMIERYVHWNEEIGDWQLKCIAYTGNNMRKRDTTGSNVTTINSPDLSSVYLSYAADGRIGGAAADSRAERNHSQRARIDAKMKALMQ